MPYRLADICNPPSAAQLVQDMHDLNCRAVGLYVVNLSVPSCVQSAGYVQQVIAAGIGVLPIVTPGDNPPYGMDLVGAMQGWGAPPCPVAFDIERFSEPGGGWVAQELEALPAAGYFVGMYGPGSDQALYSGSPFGWRWLADWTFIEEILPPYQAMQWTDQAVAPSGNRYDLSDVEDDLLMWGMGTATTGELFEMTPEEHTWLQSLVAYRDQNLDPLLRDIQAATSKGTGVTGDVIAQILAKVSTVSVAGGLTAAQAQLLQEVHDAVARLEAALKQA